MTADEYSQQQQERAKQFAPPEPISEQEFV